MGMNVITNVNTQLISRFHIIERYFLS